MHNHQIKALNRSVQAAALIASVGLLALPAHAAGTGMPWEGPLDQIDEDEPEPVIGRVNVPGTQLPKAAEK